MSVFTRLEAQLTQFAAEQQAVLTRDRENSWPYGADKLGFEERRIDWQRDGMNLAIIIQPNFHNGVDTTKWNFRAVAWQYRPGGTYSAEERGMVSVPFRYLADRIESLLSEARIYLTALRPSDLQPPPYSRER